jgi:hypothetical protein
MAVIDSYTTGEDASAGFSNTYWLAQTFTASISYSITSVIVKLHKGGGTPSADVTVSIRNTSGGLPYGSDLTSGTTVGSTLPVSPGEERTITLTPYNLVKGTKYAIVVRGGGTGSYPAYVRDDSSIPAYSGGNVCYAADSGVTWYSATNLDMMFQTIGTTSPPTDKVFSKALVAIGGNEVWYESTAGTMTELTAANGDIDTSTPLMAVSAFQKVFIANKTNLKIADFENTKITTDDIAPAGKTAPSRGDVLVGQTSAAQMVVDYIDATDSTANVYGYRTTVTTFVSGETVQVGAGGTTQFVLNANETAPPHWYDWTVYGNDTTTYGIMPSEATIVCSFNSRLVLAGDSVYPHQWCMSGVFNPFDWLYDSSDPLTPIRGGDGDAGKVGDIITALISPKDDLTIHGCANSVWMIVGDPAFHGQIINVSKDTGIWGSRAWCIDGDRNLYFLGDDGLYRITMGETISTPVNISSPSLPTLMDDLDLDKSLHRVVLTYDGDNNGIIISRTLFSDGTNTNYWFDLTTQGFFPESYPATQGIFSSHKYAATDRTYAKLLIGCNDGYIREFDPDTKNDDGTTVDSYFSLGPIPLANSPVGEGIIGPIDIVLAGGASGGSETDSDDADYKIFVADTAAELIEKLVANGAPSFAGTVAGPGRRWGSRQVRTARGVYGGVRIGNDTSGEGFIFECINIGQQPRGRIK